MLMKGTIVRTVFVALELIALIVVAIVTFSNDGSSAWGYWGAVAVVFIILSPIYVYVIASAIFNAFNLNVVLKKCHTVESMRKYHNWSRVFLVWGFVTGVVYGCLLVPIFLLENLFLFLGYREEIANINHVTET